MESRKVFSWLMYGISVYLPTWMVDFYGINVDKYTVRPMHNMGMVTAWVGPQIDDGQPRSDDSS